MLKIIKAHKPQILHCHLFYANYFGRLAAIFAGVKAVFITEHGTYSYFKRFYHHGIDFILSLFTDRIIAVSESVRQYLLKHSRINFCKIAVLYNAIDAERFDLVYRLDKNLIRKKLGFTDSDLLIGCISTLVPWKGQHLLLEAFSEIVKFYPQSRLCIVGRNPNKEFRNRLQGFIRDNGFLKNVYFLGERRDVPEILRALDIFAFPSLTEGLGISLLEAMYMALPAVATNREGISEVIDDGKDGLLFNAGDAKALSRNMLLLINDKEYALKIGLNARKKVMERFLPAHYIDGLQLLYRNCLNENTIH